MKYGKFRKIEFSVSHTHSYGRYIIDANYRGKHIRVSTTDSEAWDWLDDDSDKEKHRDALRHCYNKITAAYYNEL